MIGSPAAYSEARRRADELTSESERISKGEIGGELSAEARRLLLQAIAAELAVLRLDMSEYATICLDSYNAASTAAFAQRALSFSGLGTAALARVIAVDEDVLTSWVGGHGMIPDERQMHRLRSLATMVVDACARLQVRDLGEWLQETPPEAPCSRYEMLARGEYLAVRRMVEALAAEHLGPEPRRILEDEGLLVDQITW